MSNIEDHAQGTYHGSGSEPLEKDFSNGYHLDSNHDADDALRKIKTTGSLSISPELFEKIYLSPQNKVSGELRKTVGNPTPIALVGFLLSLSPLSCDLMNWRGTQAGSGTAGIGFYIGFGAICMFLGGIGEWVLGNTFPAVVFSSFGGFWVAFAMTLMPYTGTISDNGGGSFTKGLESQTFNASFAFIQIFMGVLVVIYAVVALRTNVVFLLIFITLIPAFSCLAAYYFYAAQGITHTGFLVGGGICAFIVSMLGWYIFFAILLAAVDFPFSLPVGDLSGIIKGASDKAKAKEDA